MSHELPIPEAARSPYPLQPAPIAQREAATAVSAENNEGGAPAAEAMQAGDDETWIDRARDTMGRVRESKVGLGAAVGIGSAALLAAALFARRGGGDGPKAKSRRGAETSKRELVEPTPGDNGFVRRTADGRLGKTVDVGKSLAADRRVKAKTVAKSGQGDRGDRKD